MKLKIAVLPGDGIGPEVVGQALNVVKTVCHKFGHELEYQYAICGAHAIDEVGDPYPEATHQLCLESDAVLYGAVGDPRFDNDPSAKIRPEQGLLAMRKKLGLFANIRPIQTFDSLVHKSPLKEELVRGADFICIRELTGGMYFGEKHEGDDMAYDTNIYTRNEIQRILKVAFEYARQRNRHLTVVDKANVLASSRLWRKVAQEMALQNPDIQTDFMFVDNASMRMIQEPRFFDVMVTENTFGDILTDEGSCITGSMGLLPSASIGTYTSVYEPIHGSWPQAAGKNVANPLATILSAAMMFEYTFGLKDEASEIRKAVDASIVGNVRTGDIQIEGERTYSTSEVGEWICEYINND
ncbi:MAG: 3-isopropylmalate dehydrogenase [Bacteroidaceae bacterium]|nr:3-isopropylmalate dehydrogenase [Bacteroidaceae bacterium]